LQLRLGRSVRHRAALVSVELSLQWLALRDYKTEFSSGVLQFLDCLESLAIPEVTGQSSV